MANINTTKTVSDTYSAQKNKVENTTKNMNKLLEKMGCKNPSKIKRVTLVIPLVPGSKDNVLFLGINGAKFYFKRGEAVNMPEPLLRFAVECGEIPKHYLDMLKLAEQNEAEAKAEATTAKE